jgi:2-polyprenyl-6-methoxyphenol hydroxylase-like FAD-dependent oxidoreductase
MMKTDVIIVGAGPTGLALACQLIRYGVDFVIFDKKETTTPYSKAIGVQARTLEIYEQIGLAQDLIAQGAIAERARLVEGGEVRGEVELTNIGEGISPFPFLLILEQGKHEKILHDFIKSNGRDVRWNTELENFSQDEAGVKAVVKTADGAAETIEAKFLVGCDGAKSFVRQALNLTFEGSTFERLFYVADVQIDWRFSHDALYVCLAQNTITAFFPMSGGENNFRIVGTFPENEDRREGEILYEEIEEQIKKDTKLDLDIHDVNWFSVYRVHSRRTGKFGEGRCFLAGDSAHIHTPAGAQGMNTGIQDGYNLAWKLAFVLSGNANQKLLETYTEERLPNAKRLLQTTDRFFDFGASEERFVSFFRTKIFPYIANLALQTDAVQKFIFPLVSQTGINYRNSSLSKNEGSFAVKAGDRMPYFTIEGASIYEKLKEPKFYLVLFSDGQTQAPDFSEILDEFASYLNFEQLPLYPHIADVFSTKQTFMTIIRPDNYIGLISGIVSPENVRDYLRYKIRYALTQSQDS